MIADVKRLRPEARHGHGRAARHVLRRGDARRPARRWTSCAIGEGEQTDGRARPGRRRRAAGFDEVRGHRLSRRTAAIRFTARRRRSSATSTACRCPPATCCPLGRYRALGMPISMTTSRGCPHRCIFCVGRRMVGARRALAQPGSAWWTNSRPSAALGFHQVNIADDLFTADAGRCTAVCDEILRRGLSRALDGLRAGGHGRRESCSAACEPPAARP
ncbi:MAG: hypothetical protein MZV70_60445 [Desulfobacterales bacterium]|nr:hypothetical protein [Desulfobacterales bacterium]